MEYYSTARTWLALFGSSAHHDVRSDMHRGTSNPRFARDAALPDYCCCAPPNLLLYKKSHLTLGRSLLIARFYLLPKVGWIYRAQITRKRHHTETAVYHTLAGMWLLLHLLGTHAPHHTLTRIARMQRPIATEPVGYVSPVETGLPTRRFCFSPTSSLCVRTNDRPSPSCDQKERQRRRRRRK